MSSGDTDISSSFVFRLNTIQEPHQEALRASYQGRHREASGSGKTATWIYDAVSVHPPPQVEHEVLHGRACVLVTTIHAIKPRKIPQASSGSSDVLRQLLRTLDFKDAIAIFNKEAA